MEDSDSGQGLAGQVNDRYDDRMFTPMLADLYEHSDFHNLGYWNDETSSQAQACEDLTRRIIETIPNRVGTVLDVACGKGATTKTLLDYYPAEQVTGINISDKQLERCRENAPGCTFLNMDAVALDFPDNHFDNIISVEAAFHFTTREAFFKEALRVLKPGGVLSISDVLTGNVKKKKLTCDENFVPDLDAYREVWQRAGFDDVEVEDVTDRCRNSFYRNMAQFARRKLQAREIDFKRFKRMQAASRISMKADGYYVLARGRKA